MGTFSLKHLEQNWFFKYKIYHLLFWGAFHFVWWAIAVGNVWKTILILFTSAHVIKYLSYVLLQTFAGYFTLYFLMPKYLEKGKFFEYVIYVLLTTICTSCLIVSGYYLTAYSLDQSITETFQVESHNYFLFFLSKNSLPSTIGNLGLAMSIKLTKNWVKFQKRQQLLEKEKLETELKFLKYQFNPHFLFNTINSIFFLIHKNPDMASDSLAKFSELLRYQLYDCNEKQIFLGNEISYLENFIELEKLRQNENLKVSFQKDYQDSISWNIAPFILMTFVENAFKHVSKHKERSNRIDIQLKVYQHEMDFIVSNSTSTNISAEAVNYGGIGLKNVQRRLDLIYPDQYQLDSNNEGDSFKIHLHLKLSGLKNTKVLKEITEIDA